MATVRGAFRQAIAAHREALGLVRAARDALEREPQESQFGAESVARQSALVRQLQDAAAELTSGWATAGWDWLAGGRRPVAQRKPGAREALLRIGTAHPVPEGFPVLVPFLGVGHLCLDVDAGDARVSGLIRSVLLRILGEATVGSVRVLAVDSPTIGPTFTPLLPLVEVDLMARPAIDLDGFRAALTEAEEHVRRAAAVPDPPTLVLAVAALPDGCTDADLSRLVALSRTGHPAGLQLVIAGYPGPEKPGAGRPPLENTTVIRSRGQYFHVGDPPGHVLSGSGRGLNCPVRLDAGPPDDLLGAVCRQVAARAAQQRSVDVAELFTDELWTQSSAEGLRTMVGRQGRETAWLALDDATPHWLVGGRTGSGRTAFLLDVLYGLTARYGPDELSLHLLDLTEGVSFAEFAPTAGDPTWVPHARTIAVESDREYAAAVLAALATEMSRRADALRQVGVSELKALRAARTDLALPRVVTVIDACDVLLTGGDATAARARALLADVARRGRAHGVHLILAGQTSSGLQALLCEEQALFGQFTLRVALAGGGGVLARPDPTADALPVGTAVVEDLTGVAGTHHQIRFPDADPERLRMLRSRMRQQLVPGDEPPVVFAGSARQHLQDDPGWARLGRRARRRVLPLGRAVDVGLPTAVFPLDTSPGRHLAILGPTEVGSDLLHAAVLGLARQHGPGTAEFVLAGLVAVADDAVDAAAAAVRDAGHRCSEVELTGLRGVISRLAHPEPDELDLSQLDLPELDLSELDLSELDLSELDLSQPDPARPDPARPDPARPDPARPDPARPDPAGTPAASGSGAARAEATARVEATYVVVWGADALAAGLRGAVDPRWGSTGLQDLLTVLQDGPSRGAHVLTWWRSIRRFRDDLGPDGRDGVAGLVALNVATPDLNELVGEDLGWHPRPNRALLVDRHLDATTPFVPFVRPERRGGAG